MPQAPVAATPATTAPPVQHLIRVEVSQDPSEIRRLSSFGLDLSHAHHGSGNDSGEAHRSLELVVNDRNLRELAAAGFETEVLIRDLGRYYEERLVNAPQFVGAPAFGAWLSPVFGSGAMSGYYNVTEIESVLDQIHNTYPNLVSAKSSLGQTHEGRDLWMVKVSDNPGVDENEPEVRFDAMHHAREPQGMQTSLWFLLWLVESYGTDPLATYLVNEREIYLIPCVNPDGYAYNESISPNGGGLWRKNRRNNGDGTFGVDLNRNYSFQWGIDDEGSSPDTIEEVYRGPSAASEPEVQAMISFIANRQFASVLSIHTFSNLWLAPLGYTQSPPANEAHYNELGALATEINGYIYGAASVVLYFANGTTLDYDHGVQGSLGWTPEIGGGNDGFWPLQERIVPLAEENRIALARTALAAGAYLHVESVSQSELLGDGDGNFEGGETISLDVSLRNSGVVSSASSTLTLGSNSPQLVVQSAADSFPALASRNSASSSSPTTVRILPGTAAGTYPLQLTIQSGVWQEVLDIQVTVGEETLVAEFDFEAAGDQGWFVGSPNDATTGTWTRDNPNGTDAQPESDHTTGGGNNTCWFTGQGSNGGGIGENDVDGGTTSLISPAFDLEGRDNATIRYWRWYSNSQGSAPNEDVFEVDLSNDDGQNWTLAEVLGPNGGQTSGGWFEVVLEPAQILPLTDQMRLRFRASDLDEGSIVEAAIDDLRVRFLGDGDCPAPTLYCQTSPNSVGPGATLATSGSTGVSDANFNLHAGGLPPGNFGLFFYGPGRNDVPLGEGNLCLASPFTRMNAQQADGSGNVSRALSFGLDFSAGSQWNFQFWYRDPAGGPNGFNFSDAVEVLFCN